MLRAEQGDLLKLSGLSYPVMVVSNDLFNASGLAIVCPIQEQAVPGPLHIKLEKGPVSGYVMCEYLKQVDLNARKFTKLTDAPYYDALNISDAVMGIFDYQIF